MATGYATHKVLGLKVSETRKWEDIRDVFLEVNKNSSKLIEIITADAWSGTLACVKNLKRPITLIMYKHKKPSENVVVKRYKSLSMSFNLKSFFPRFYVFIFLMFLPNFPKQPIYCGYRLL